MIECWNAFTYADYCSHHIHIHERKGFEIASLQSHLRCYLSFFDLYDHLIWSTYLSSTRCLCPCGSFFFKKKLLSSLSHQTNHMAPVQFTTRLVLPVHKYSTVRLSVQNMDKISRWRGCRSPSSVQRKGEERGKHYVLSY